MRAKNNLLLFIFITIGTVAFSQYQSYNYFISFSGKYYKSDGKNGVIQASNSNFKHPDIIDHQAGYSAISDKQGNLEYYSDGYSIFNKYNQRIIGSLKKNQLVNFSTRFIFKIAGSEHSYAVFAQTSEKVYFQFFNLEGVYLIDSLFDTEKIDGFPGIMNHCSGKGNWLLTKLKGVNKYKAYFLDSSGIKSNPVISNIISNRVFNYTNHFYSPNSRYFTVFSGSTGFNSPFDCDIFSFNPESGEVLHKKNLFTNRSTATKTDLTINSPYASFSPEGKYLFLFGRYLPKEGDNVSKSGTTIFRYNLENDLIELVYKSNSMTLIYPAFFNLINPRQLVYTITRGFTVAEVGYGYSAETRLFAIENTDAELKQDIAIQRFYSSIRYFNLLCI